MKNTPTRWLLLPIAAALLTACASSKGIDPKPQATLSSDNLSLNHIAHRSGLAQAHTAWPKSDWWLSWNDPQLNQLIATGLQNSPTLAQALAKVHAAQAQAGLSESQIGSSLGIAAGYDGVRLPSSIVPSEFGGGSLDYSSHMMAQFKWDIDLWGGKRAAWQAAVGEVQASEIDAQAARIAMSTAIARTYAQLAAAHYLHDVASANVQRTSHLNQLQHQRSRIGVDNQIPLQQTQAEAAAARQALTQAQQQIDNLRLALMQLTAQAPDGALRLQRPKLTPASVQFAEYIPTDASIALLAHRADVTAAKLRVQAAQDQIASAKTLFLPNISLGALAGAVGDKHFDLFHMANVFYQFGPSISLPIFESGELQANLSGQNARYEAAVAHYNETLVGAAHAVAEAVNNAQSLRQQIAQQQQTVQAAQQAWRLVQSRYQAGLTNLLQVLQVQQQLLTAEQRLAQLHGQRMDNAIALTYALGGGYTAPTQSSNSGR